MFEEEKKLAQITLIKLAVIYLKKHLIGSISTYKGFHKTNLKKQKNTRGAVQENLPSPSQFPGKGWTVPQDCSLSHNQTLKKPWNLHNNREGDLRYKPWLNQQGCLE